MKQNKKIKSIQKILNDFKKTHVEWLDFYKKDITKEKKYGQIAGDIKHQNHCIEKYNKVLDLLTDIEKDYNQKIKERELLYNDFNSMSFYIECLKEEIEKNDINKSKEIFEKIKDIILPYRLLHMEFDEDDGFFDFTKLKQKIISKIQDIFSNIKRIETELESYEEEENLHLVFRIYVENGIKSSYAEYEKIIDWLINSMPVEESDKVTICIYPESTYSLRNKNEQ